MPLLINRRVQQLEAQQPRHEDCAHDLARSALCQPPFDPGKDGSCQQNIERSKNDQRQRNPQQHSRPRYRDAKPDAHATKPAEDG